MSDLAKVEGDEVVIRIPISTLAQGAIYSGVVVTDAIAFAPHFAREMNAEGMDEETFLNKVMDAACLRAAESDAPGAMIQKEGGADDID